MRVCQEKTCHSGGLAAGYEFSLLEILPPAFGLTVLKIRSKGETGMEKDELWKELTSSTWQVDRPVIPEKILARLNGPLVTLFTPWGPPYQNRGLDLAHGPEPATVKGLAEIKNLFEHYDRRVVWQFMGADAYGTEVNQKNGKSRVSPKTVGQYFAQIELLLKRSLGPLYFHTWSKIRRDASLIMVSFLEELTDEFVAELVGPELLDEACQTSRAINGFKCKEEARVTAIEYLKQRLFEAEIVETLWHPVKVSLAPPHKDRVVDGPLPVLYLVPQELRAPWLK